MEKFVSKHSYLILNKVISVSEGLSMLGDKVDKLIWQSQAKLGGV
jgi:hypothetical protein